MSQVRHSRIALKTRGTGDLCDLSDAAHDAVLESGCREGICTIFVGGSTAAVTTIEFEPGLKHDFPRALAKIAPPDAEYEHNATWGDGNGFSHIQASLLGPSITVPFADGKLLLGQWQQPVLVECDNRGRARDVHFTVIGQ